MATDFFHRQNKAKLIFILLGLFFFSVRTIHAEYFSFDEFNFTMDLPEGFELSEMDESGDAFFFETKILPVKFALKLYDAEERGTAEGVMNGMFSQLMASGQTEQVNWYGRNCTISNFQFYNMSDRKQYSGWALCIQVPLRENPGKKIDMLFMTYADSAVSRDCDQFMLSILDSVCFCREDFRRPGPVTAFAFPRTETAAIHIAVAGEDIYPSLEKDAAERSRFVIDREFAVLKLYANHKKWKEAWQRYYRLIFKESYSALDDTAGCIYRALLPKAQRISSGGTQLEIIKMILDWIQDFEYSRDRQNADFTAVTAAIQNFPSDCDSRSMLMCILAEHFGIPSKLFISREYSHAVFGLALDSPGAKIACDGTDYLLGETTAKVSIGLIAKEQSDTEKWIAVDLP